MEEAPEEFEAVSKTLGVILTFACTCSLVINLSVLWTLWSGAFLNSKQSGVYIFSFANICGNCFTVLLFGGYLGPAIIAQVGSLKFGFYVYCILYSGQCCRDSDSSVKESIPPHPYSVSKLSHTSLLESASVTSTSESESMNLQKNKILTSRIKLIVRDVSGNKNSTETYYANFSILKIS